MIDVPEHLELSSRQARVLGCLIEKQATTPDAYPLTLNALTTACNQTTNRDPVVAYTPREVEEAVHELKAVGLARIVHPGSGERATKFRHIADEALALGREQLAILGVLLLRGAQTVPELRTRTERQHRFASNEDVEAALRAMAEMPRSLVADIGRRPGQRETRWIQLIEADLEARTVAAGSSGDHAGAGGAVRSAATGSSLDGAIAEIAARLEALEERLELVIDALGDLVDLPPRRRDHPTTAAPD